MRPKQCHLSTQDGGLTWAWVSAIEDCACIGCRAYTAGRKEERGEIVASLRAQADKITRGMHTSHGTRKAGMLRMVADAIENGDDK